MSDDDDGDDGEIRQLLRSGKRKQANGKVVEVYGGALRRYVRSRAPQGADLTDLEDTCWEGIFRALPRFTEDAPIIALVIGVARHKVADAFGPPSFDALPSQISGVPALFPGRDRPPSLPGAEREKQEEQKKEEKRIQRIRRALEELGESDRELLDLRWVQELKPRVIASVLGGGVKAGTISQRLLMARKRFIALCKTEPRK